MSGDPHAPKRGITYNLCWCYSNMGRVIGIERTRKDAVRACEEWSGYPWEEAKEFCEVWRASVEYRQF